MTAKKLVLIVDKSEAYINFQKRKFLQQWGADKALPVSSLEHVGTETLFGDTNVSHWHLSTVEDCRTAGESLAKLSPEQLSDLTDAGLILSTTQARTYTKKVEAAIKKAEGTLILPPSKKEETLSVKLVNELNLAPAVRAFLLDYIGENYDTLIPLVESLSEVPRAYHPRITEEDLYMRFPQPPGAVPPWDIEEPLFTGDLTRAIDVSRRVAQHASHLVWLSILKKKMESYYQVSLYLQENPRATDDQVTAALGLNVRGFYYTKKRVKSYSTETFKRALWMITQAEGQVKGDSAAPKQALLEVLLVELGFLFQQRR